MRFLSTQYLLLYDWSTTLEIMFSTVGSLLDRLQGLFSKGLVVGGLIPLLFLFFINWGLLYYFFPASWVNWSVFVLPPKDGGILYWTKVALIFFIGGLVLWNLNPFFSPVARRSLLAIVSAKLVLC